MTGSSAGGSITAVVFDLGRVLVEWDPRHLYRTFIPHALADEVAMERFLAEICTPEWNEAQDRGRPFAEGIAEAVARHPEHETLIRAFFDRWGEMVPYQIDGTVEILGSLRDAGVPVYALSNWSMETFPIARSRFGFLDWFDGMVISGDVGLVKPEPEIYHHLCRAYDLDPATSVFIDDAPRNVATAETLGFRTILYRDAATTADALRALGLL
jgi:2-haloacid dehalogenase